MNASLMYLEIWVIVLGIVLMLADFLFGGNPQRKKALAYLAIAALGVMLLTLLGNDAPTGTAFNGDYIQDPLAIFFKRFFVVAAILVLFVTSEFSEKIASAVPEFYSLVVFALAGMLFAASSNDFAMLFVSIELITVTFYVLVSYQRRKLSSLEAGVKYLIIGALSSAFMVFGIALIWGTTGKMNFTELAAVVPQFLTNKIFLAGVLFLLTGLGFKIAAVPFQIWAPDVYQGAPTPTTAFLAVGSKAAGFVLLLRVLFTAVPGVAHQWSVYLMVIAGLTILYGNLCAIPQRNLKRLLGYSSIAHAGYLLLGVAALSESGMSAVMYYLAGYLFTIVAAFTVITLVMQHLDNEDISALAGLNQRSPMLATTMTFAMVSLAGLPPLAGFFGKFLLLKAIIAEGPVNYGYYYLAFVALAGIIISFYYYFGVIRAIYWSKEAPDLSPIRLSGAAKLSIAICIAGMIWLGTFPNVVVNLADQAAHALK
ncbi:MAG TPA: NADH-quinone oxidoreductase subunit N [Verrucomicrobiae bacterium]|jgi:NADH-quinone oxidoreductase subunit N|nr:NADH-quinone oxidoreductase subunit N [Verrucomicrobiae bacterium]